MGLLVLLVLFVLLSSSVAPARGQFIRDYRPLPNGAGTVAIEPNPMIEGNITFATHTPTQGLLQFPNALGVQSNMSAVLDPRVQNPIQLNTANVVAVSLLQGDKVNATYWNSSTTNFKQTKYNGGGSLATGPTAATVNGQPAMQSTLNGTSKNVGQLDVWYTIASANWPSTNTQFDYVTWGGSISGPACPGGSGCSLLLGVGTTTAASGGSPLENYLSYWKSNGTTPVPTMLRTGGPPATQTAVAGATAYASLSLLQLGYTTVPAYVTIDWLLNVSQGTTTPFTLSITELATGSTPLTYGTTRWGAQNLVTGNWGTSMIRTALAGNDNLTTLAASFTYGSIANGGFTTAVVQRAADLANATLTTSAINVANSTSGGPNWNEQITYNFPYQLPIAPALTYGTFKLVDELNISGTQYISVSFGGTSYTAAYAAYPLSGGASANVYPNGKWQTVQASVTATTAQSWIGIIDYTGPQWDSISVAPGLFSAAGLQYYWFLLIGLVFTLGGAGASAWVVSNKRALQQRSPRGVGRVPFEHLVDVYEAWRASRRNLRRSRIGSARHTALIVIGLIMVGAAIAAIWAAATGADPSSVAATFVAGFFIFAIVGGVTFAGFEVYHHYGRKLHG